MRTGRAQMCSLASGMNENWAGRIVIVTGGGGGMGQAAAKRFAEAGAKTFVFGRTLDSLQETAALSKNISPVVCDVADTASVAAALDEVLRHGVPSALIHTAGINTPDRFMAHADPARIASAESWRRVIEINVLGVANMVIVDVVRKVMCDHFPTDKVVNPWQKRSIRRILTCP